MTKQSPSDESPIREWKNLTGSDFESLDKANTVCLVTCSPLEVHGPHLPVIADSLEAEAIALRVAEKLHDRHAGMSFLRLPPIYVAADVLPHVGSVAFRQSTIIRVLSDLGRSLAKQGFRHIWVSNFHGGPRHFVSIDVACERVNRRHQVAMIPIFSLLLKQLTGGATDLSDILGHIDGLSRESLKGDSHAGAVETSLLLHLLGERVKGSYKDLEPMTVNIKMARDGHRPFREGRPTTWDLLRGFRHKLKYFETELYAGSPSVASAEIGKEVLEVLTDHATEALDDVWTGAIRPDQCYSPLWPIRWLFTSETVGWAFERAFSYRSKVW